MEDFLPFLGLILWEQRKPLSSKDTHCYSFFRWYHGKLDRTIAEERLWQVEKPGSYLIRESDRRPGSFVLSFLSKTNVNHFRWELSVLFWILWSIYFLFQYMNKVSSDCIIMQYFRLFMLSLYSFLLVFDCFKTWCCFRITLYGEEWKCEETKMSG